MIRIKSLVGNALQVMTLRVFKLHRVTEANATGGTKELIKSDKAT